MIKKKAYAKFDLGIKISPDKGEDGYYSMHYIDCQLDLCDELLFEAKKKDIEIICSDKSLPEDERNFVFRAAELLKSLAGNPDLGAKINLKKNIPIKAGFGGGSSDAAATIRGLSHLWKVNIDDEAISRFARDLGKDFFYSMYGGVSEVEGIGRDYKLVSLSLNVGDFWCLVLVPYEEKPSTAWVYKHLIFKKRSDKADSIQSLRKTLIENDRIRFLKNTFNDFEMTVLTYFPVVGEMKNDLIRAGANKSIMAGSGLSVVGFFDNRQKVEEGCELLKDKYKLALVSRILNS